MNIIQARVVQCETKRTVIHVKVSTITAVCGKVLDREYPLLTRRHYKHSHNIHFLNQQDVSTVYCSLLQSSDNYDYSQYYATDSEEDCSKQLKRPTEIV